MKYNENEKWKYVSLDYSRRGQYIKAPQNGLPNENNIKIAEEKYTKYLFSGENKIGIAKGNAFNSRLGYNIDNYPKLDKEIREAAVLNPATLKENSEYGNKYEQKVVLYGLKDTPANVVIGWIVNGGETRMTSAYIKEI